MIEKSEVISSHGSNTQTTNNNSNAIMKTSYFVILSSRDS